MNASWLLIGACVTAYLYTLVKGLTGDKRVQLYGPIVLVKCERCASLIKRLTHASIRNLSWLAVGTWVVAMLFAVVMLIASAVASLALSPEQAPRPELMIGLPGVNPLIPVSYGAVALAVAVAVHEIAHGVTLAANNVSIRSAGIVLLGVPLGAFVEPGDDFQASREGVKVKVYSSGPFANLGVAALTLLLLTQMFAAVKPLEQGIGVLSVYSGSPAEKCAIRPGDIIVAIDGTRISNIDTFFSILGSKKAGDVITIKLADGRSLVVELADRYDFTHLPEEKGKGFLGIEPIDLNNFLAAALPVSGRVHEIVFKLLSVLLVFERVAPYLPRFYTQPVGGWEAAYALLWIAWMNAALGLTNVLPLVPLDGGSALASTLRLLLKSFPASRRESIVKAFTVIVSTITLALIAAPILIPRIKLVIPAP